MAIKENSDRFFDGRSINLYISGVGIIFYSPSSVRHISSGEDYLESSFTTEKDVQSHIQRGSLVGFGTGSPGTFRLQFYWGYPTDELIVRSDFKLRLGLHCIGGVVYFRDLYDLMSWDPDCPVEQSIPLEDGHYHVTLCSSRPASGTLGDSQIIQIYLNPLTAFPDLARQGIPTLCS